MTNLFDALFTPAAKQWEQINMMNLPVDKITSAHIEVSVNKETNQPFRKIKFNLADGSYKTATVSKRSEYALADAGTEVPVNGSLFQLLDIATGEAGSTIYWSEAV